MSAEASEVSAQVSAPAPSAPQSAPSASPVDRLKAFLSAPEPEEAPMQTEAASAPAGNSEGESAPAEVEPVPVKDQAEPKADGQSREDAPSEDWKPATVSELADALGWDADRVFDLDASVKIDGKEGQAKIRDLVKSYQLDKLHHQRLETLNNDRKAFEARQAEFAQERADKLLRMDAGLKTLERSLMGEFSSVDWQKLAIEDPNDYNAKLVSFQQRNAHLQDVANQIAAEQQTHQQKQAEQAQAKLAEERELLLAKVPEWADEKALQKDKADIVGYLNDLGMDGKQAFEAIADHRHMLVIRAAWQWNKLQQSKPAVLNKVRIAPKLLKPGSQQSRDASNAVSVQKDHARLKQTGKISDATKLLKSRLFG